uniref:Uncharacterized mitochondrial protein AtMg00810-like n=1 Tax=Nicotiana tabacum TaxID=4097 RepID=A0A1S3YD71_TOBAC|nr:PREDICTED: uncharacterized mitochondrial protein AtMg00810-like [Nicotiana tabacum]
MDTPNPALREGSEEVLPVKFVVEQEHAPATTNLHTQHVQREPRNTTTPIWMKDYVTTTKLSGNSKLVIVRTVISVVASKYWPLFQMDVNNAFLQGDFTEAVYMDLPLGISQTRGVQGLSGYRPVATPMELNHKLTTVDYDNHVGNTEDKLDISFVVQVLSQFMQNPKQSDLDAVLRVVRYIKESPGLGLLLKKREANNLTVFCDSDWAACPNTRRSTTGYIVKLGDSLLSWKSKKQQTISRSSVEAEYRSMVGAVAKTIWMVGLLEECKNSVIKPVHLHCDSKAALQIAANPIFHE